MKEEESLSWWQERGKRVYLASHLISSCYLPSTSLPFLPFPSLLFQLSPLRSTFNREVNHNIGPSLTFPSMASPSQPLSLSLSLDASLKPFLSPFLSGRHCRYFRSHQHQNLSPSSVRCSPQPQSPSTTTFLSPLSLSRLQTLSTFSHTHHFPFPYPSSDGQGPATLLIRPMLDSEIDDVATLLAESFIEILFFPPDYARLLAFLVKNYILDRRALLPHTAILVGILSGDGSDQQQEELACTAEISFDQRGSNAASPTPVPPPDCPYICNMTVKHSFRRLLLLLLTNISRKRFNSISAMLINIR